MSHTSSYIYCNLTSLKLLNQVEAIKKLRGVGNVALHRFQLLQFAAALWCCPGCQWAMLWRLTRLPNFLASRSTPCWQCWQCWQKLHQKCLEQATASRPASRTLQLAKNRQDQSQEVGICLTLEGSIHLKINDDWEVEWSDLNGNFQPKSGRARPNRHSNAEPCHHLGSSTVRYIKSFCGLCIASCWKATHDDKRQHEATNPQVAASVSLDGNIQLSLTANQVPRSKIHQQKKQLGQERNLSKPSWEGNLRRVGQVILHHCIYLISIETIVDELWCPPHSKHPNGSKWQQQGARWALPHVQRASRNNGSTCKMGKLSNSSRRYRR